jgi:hypothetical protein
MKRLLLLALLSAAAPAAAENCSRFADPLAYNSCLASQGPAARAVRVGKAPAGRPASRSAPRRQAVVSRRGRSEMVFTPRK